MDHANTNQENMAKPDWLCFQDEYSGKTNTFCLQEGQRALVVVYETNGDSFNASLIDAFNDGSNESDTAALCAAAALAATSGLPEANKDILAQDLFGAVREYLAGIIVKRILEGNYHVCNE